MEGPPGLSQASTAPWDFGHGRNAAAGPRVPQDGYKLESPRQQDEARQAKTHHDEISARDATAIQTSKCGGCGAQFLPEKLHMNPAINCPRLCAKCLVTEAEELALELHDLKGSIEAADAAAIEKADESRDEWHKKADRLVGEVTRLTSDVTNLRQRLLILRDPAS